MCSLQSVQAAISKKKQKPAARRFSLRSVELVQFSNAQCGFRQTYFFSSEKCNIIAQLFLDHFKSNPVGLHYKFGGMLYIRTMTSVQ